MRIITLRKYFRLCGNSLFTYNYSINVLSKCSSIISHRPSIFEGRHTNHRSLKVDTSIINLRRSTHRSSKVDTSIVDLRRSTQRSSKIEGGNIAPTIHHRILSTTALHSIKACPHWTRIQCALNPDPLNVHSIHIDRVHTAK